MDHQASKCSVIPQDTSEKAVSTRSPRSSDAALHGLKRKQIPVVAVEDFPPQKMSCSKARSDSDETESIVTNRLPPNVDPEVFSLLPDDIQKELLSPTYTSSFPCTSVNSAKLVNIPHPTKTKSPQSGTDSQKINNGIRIQEVSKLECFDSGATANQQSPAGTSALSGGNVLGNDGLSLPLSSDCEFPGNVDPRVFSELPSDIQRELISEWKQQKPLLKSALSRKPGRSSTNKDRKAAGKSSQANNLLKYFKPT